MQHCITALEASNPTFDLLAPGIFNLACCRLVQRLQQQIEEANTLLRRQ